jgi:hypothetical protein
MFVLELMLWRMVGLLRDLIYTYKYREIITSIRKIILDEEDDGLSYLQNFYFRELSRIGHIVLKLSNDWVQMLWVWYICQTYSTLGLIDHQGYTL